MCLPEAYGPHPPADASPAIPGGTQSDKRAFSIGRLPHRLHYPLPGANMTPGLKCPNVIFNDHFNERYASGDCLV